MSWPEPLKMPSLYSTGAGAGRSAASISRASAFQSPRCDSARVVAVACVAPPAIASAYACSTCWASSATISASRSGLTRSPPRRCPTNAFQSRMIEPRQSIQCIDELPPGTALLGERGATGRGEFVVAAAPFAGLLHPLALDQFLALHAIQQRVETGDVELQTALRL